MIPPLVPDFHFDAEVGRVWFACPGTCRESGFLDNVRWTIERMDPLTVSPSVHCLKCQTHGFIRNGLWEPA